MKFKCSTGWMLVAAAAGCSPNSASMSPDFKAPALKDEMPEPPARAQFTICCQIFASADHAAISKRIRDGLLAEPGSNLDKWYVVHSDDKSVLYYGFYRCFDPRDPTDGAEGQRAKDDLDAVRTLSNSNGRLFPQSLPAPISTPDPAANPAWDLVKSKGFWTLEVAAFKDTPNRKELAVAAVQQARDQGKEAYYYHGPVVSSVCIGSWPKRSAVEVTANRQLSDPNAEYIVSSEPIPASANPDNLPTIQPKVDILDPTLHDALRKNTEHSVNGFTLHRWVLDPKTGTSIDVVEQPFLAKIPEKVASARDAALNPVGSYLSEPKGGGIDDPGMSAMKAIDGR